MTRCRYVRRKVHPGATACPVLCLDAGGSAAVAAPRPRPAVHPVPRAHAVHRPGCQHGVALTGALLRTRFLRRFRSQLSRSGARARLSADCGRGGTPEMPSARQGHDPPAVRRHTGPPPLPPLSRVCSTQLHCQLHSRLASSDQLPLLLCMCLPSSSQGQAADIEIHAKEILKGSRCPVVCCLSFSFCMPQLALTSLLAIPPDFASCGPLRRALQSVRRSTSFTRTTRGRT